MNELILFAVGQGQASAQQSCAGGLFPILLMLPVFYFMLIRPQQKRQQAHHAMQTRLKKGDRVVTDGGVLGTISAVDAQEIEVLVADKVRIKVIRNQVSLVEMAAEIPADASAKTKKDGK